MASLSVANGRQSTRWWPKILGLAVVIVGLYVILPQVGDLHSSVSSLSQASPVLVVLALLASLATYFWASATYCLIAFRPLRYGRTVVVQLAGMLANRLLPAGIGGLGLNYLYLRTQKHRAGQAAAAVSVNNGLGLVGHLLLLAGLLLLGPAVGPIALPHLARWQLEIGGLVLVVLVAISATKIRPIVARAGHSFLKNLLAYRQRTGRLLLALATSMLLTAFNCLSFWLCSRAVGLHIAIVAVFLVFTFGVIVGTATPTPGGLGGVEASLVAGLVSLHISAAQALSAVLLYRILSYWLPLGLGSVAFIAVQRRHYIRWEKF